MATVELVIVFGGSGFIGTHLVRSLREAGLSIISADILPPREKLEGVDYRIADVRDLKGFTVSGPVSRIYNLAAVHRTPGHPDNEYYETNILGALEVTALAERLGCKHIVFTSSISVYGPSEEMKTEISSPAPASSYGHSKLIAERTHEQWLARNPDARLTIVRPAVVFGPGENGNFARLAALLRKGFFVYPGRRDTIKACIYVEDLIAAIAFAESRTTRFVLFNGAYAQRHTIQAIVETIMKRYFPAARTFLVPGPAVRAAAKALRVVDALKIGIHPDRVTKLIRSTDICPKWLIDEGFVFPNSLGEVIDRWAAQTKGSFV